MDPLPFPLDEYKDLSTDPGDDFWRYCNGAWYDSTPVPESRGVGGLYDPDPVGAEMKKNLFAEDPSLHRYRQLVDSAVRQRQGACAGRIRIIPPYGCEIRYAGVETVLPGFDREDSRCLPEQVAEVGLDE